MLVHGDLQAELPLWGLAVVLSLPLLDLAHSFTPWSRRLWVDHDHSSWVRFWSVVTGLRWLQTLIAAVVLVIVDVPFSAVGVRLPVVPVTIGSALVAIGGLGWYGYVASRAPTVKRSVAPTDFDTNYPADGRERILWVLSGAITAGICEEFVYRGVVLAGLIGLGIPWPIAVLLAAVPFALAHGLAVVNPFAVAFYVGTAVVFSGLVLATGSLLPAVAVHGTWNLVSTAKDLDEDPPESVEPQASA